MLAVTFPGQGSQAIGMGQEVAQAYPQAKAVFEEVNEALRQDLSGLMWSGSEDELRLTSNAQPALMAVSLAVLRAMESEGFKVTQAQYVAGHSLGEYSALAAAHALSIGDTARLLRIRGNAMQEAVPAGQGAMAAIIGLEQAAVDSLCAEASTGGESVQIANDNGGGQLVISGHAGAVQRACEAAKAAGAKRALPLPVSAPFHSSLMEPAAERMREALANVEIKAAIVPLVANVTAEPVTHPNDIAKLLVKQVTGRVRWAESVGYMVNQGVGRIWEVGSGKVLTGLARRIERGLETAAIQAPADIKPALDSLDTTPVL